MPVSIVSIGTRVPENDEVIGQIMLEDEVEGGGVSLGGIGMLLQGLGEVVVETGGRSFCGQRKN